MVNSFFVYGTLKRGQRNVGIWPAKPRSVSSGWVYGQLFARADYPAMIAGNDHVLGELWTFEPPDVDKVVAALDRLEGTNQPGQIDLYQRIVSPVYNLRGEQVTQAFLYSYQTDPGQEGFTRTVGEVVSWP